MFAAGSSRFQSKNRYLNSLIGTTLKYVAITIICVIEVVSNIINWTVIKGDVF